MYSKHEAAATRREFWTALGIYMSPIPGFGGARVNWINYKTGEKYIRFRMEAGTRLASIAISITHPDAGMRALYFDQFRQLRVLLRDCTNEEWDWQQEYSNEEGRVESRIFTSIDNVNIMDRSKWPAIIAFLKPRMIALDQFWFTARELFADLR